MKVKRSRFFGVIIALAVYLLGVAIGELAMLTIPKYRHEEDMYYEARSCLSQYLKAGKAEIALSNKLFAIYAEDGKLIYYTCSTNHPMEYDTDKYILPHLSYALKHEHYYKMLLMRNGITSYQSATKDCKLGGELDFAALAGVRFELNGQNAVAFYSSDQAALSTYLIIYFAVFTLNYAFLFFVLRRLEKYQQKLDAIQKIYIDNITHDLKAPVASIRALAMSMNDHDMTQEEESRCLGLIISESNKQEKMIQDILDISKLQAKSNFIKKEKISGSQLFSDICRKCAVVCDGMDIAFQPPEALDSLPELFTDAALIQRLLNIIVDNSLKYVENDGRIKMSITEKDEKIVVSVKDNGIGIEKADMAFIFDRFYRGGKSTRAGGNGLGLAVAKEIVTALQEKIWVESEPGKGTEFSFTIKKS